jgi:hypothetical protein
MNLDLNELLLVRCCVFFVRHSPVCQMGHGRSVPESNDASTKHVKQRADVINNESVFREKHIPEYPPLIICKDSQVQTTVSYSSRRQEKQNSTDFYRLSLLAAMLYCFSCFVICFSFVFQTTAVYMNIFNYPFGDLSNLNRFNINNGRNIKFLTEDNILIHGWHILPPGDLSLQSASITNLRDRNIFFDNALREADTIIIQLHGNAGNRAFYRRVDLMHKLSSQVSAHVIAIDYRGFGDSGGWPTEKGIALDTRALWTWLENILHIPNDQCRLNDQLQCSKKVPRVFLYGCSLGAAIATELAHHILQHSHSSSRHSSSPTAPYLLPSGLILNAPFSSIAEAAADYPYALPFRPVMPIM